MAERSGTSEPEGSADLSLLHPELLSEHFLRLTLEQKNIPVDNALLDKQGLTDIYVQHVIPLPQRSLPKNRWGKKMEEKRTKNVSPVQQNKSFSTRAPQGFRKRPLIVFDGSSTTTSIKVKKENETGTDRLKPPPSGNTTNTIRRISLSSSNSSSQPPVSSPPKTIRIESKTGVIHSPTAVTHGNSVISIEATTVVKLKRAAPKDELETLDEAKPVEAKKKIQHITWP